ncbi:MAG: 4Fe-4S dicluster domain-containing protein [Symbiobacterium sp.]|uniref:4Fe-4S dicluster domain-containing protein n=1 Tax=Symbiobacterium sp. TaxID=1971213 RepID=UPI0034648FFE
MKQGVTAVPGVRPFRSLMAALRPRAAEAPDDEIRPCHQCLRCVGACPSAALTYVRPRWRLDLSRCLACRECTEVCPNPLINNR